MLQSLGLSPDWAVNIISQVGNYEEVFEANLGKSTPLKIARGANQLYQRWWIILRSTQLSKITDNTAPSYLGAVFFILIFL